MSEPIRLRANAKLNLFLRVTGSTERGWHEIETIFHSVRLADVLELRKAPGGELEVEMAATDPLDDSLPAPEDNLVHKAAAGVARFAHEPVGASLTVRKAIPIGGGLAGGSADAAATILGLIALWGLDVDRSSVLELAGALGSDVAFCLDGGTASATGRGNELTQLPAPPPMWFVLGMSDRPLMTAAVYDAWDQLGTSGSVTARAMTAALAQGDLEEIGRLLHNDLCLPAIALRPEIEAGVAALRDAGAVAAGMSGSGPTVFGIASGEAHASELARKVRSSFARVEVVASAPSGVEEI
jgi:4-diphosphocytidyl-2-C-methyl-D-erythritol kinase